MGLSPDVLHSRIEITEHAPGILEEPGARLGQVHRPRRAIEQAHAKPILQGRDRTRDRRWRAVQRACSLGEPLGFGNRDEHAQLVEAIH